MQYGEFLQTFMSLINRLNLSESKSELLTKFIHQILPQPNMVPTSYYKIRNQLNISKLGLIRRQYVCVYCNCKLNPQETCTKQACLRFKQLKANNLIKKHK